MFVLVIKTIIKLPFTTSLGVGELSDLIYGAVLVLPAAILYKKKREFVSVFAGLVVGFLLEIAVSLVVNIYVMIPFYMNLMGFSEEAILHTLQIANPSIKNITWDYGLFAVLPFNLIKNAAIIILTIVSFSFMSSVVYIVNDILDIESDRNHPTKKNRPIASGQLSVKDAIVCAIVLFVISVLLSVFVSIKIDTYLVCLIIILYFVNNMLYSVFHLKNIPLLDVCLLTIGFILRLFVGAVCAGVKNSAWLYLVIIFGSFYLGFGKRKSELVKIKNMNTRKSLMLYDETFLNNAVLSSMILSIAFFALSIPICLNNSISLLLTNLSPYSSLTCFAWHILILL